MEINNTDFVFQTDSAAVKNKREHNNYLIVYDKENKDKETCAIYFSSNDIYFPNTEEAFRSRIIEKDFYEMYHTRVNGTSKHIFVRDIQKQWYIEGINARINSPERLLEFLKKETEGYSLTTIGSSAGGYAAILYGSLLSAKRIMSFNGQFEVKSLLHKSNKHIDPLLFRNSNSSLARYFDLSSFIADSVYVHHFSSLKSAWDAQQYDHIKDHQSIRPIFFRTSHHGVPFVKSALPIVINMDESALDDLVGKTYNPLLFSLKLAGISKTFATLYKQVKRKLK